MKPNTHQLQYLEELLLQAERDRDVVLWANNPCLLGTQQKRVDTLRGWVVYREVPDRVFGPGFYAMA